MGRIVGFLGSIGSGKGTSGHILTEHYGFVSESFARPVKDAVAAIFGWDRELLEGTTKESRTFRDTPDTYWSKVYGRPYTPREALQVMGTDAGRNVFHRDLWVSSLGKRMDPSKDYVITDVRFPNEIDYIKSIGGDVFVVERNAGALYEKQALIVNKASNWDSTVQKLPDFDVHYSEWAWIGYSALSQVIRNDGTVDELETNICMALQLQSFAV